MNYNGLCGAELESKLSKLYKSSSREGRSHTPQSRSHTPPLMLGDSHGSLFLELGNLCLENSLHDLTQDCLKQVPKSLLHNDAKLLLCRELLHSQLLVARQDGSDQVYTKELVEARIKVMSRLEEVLKSALRLGDPDVIQVSIVCTEFIQHATTLQLGLTSLSVSAFKTDIFTVHSMSLLGIFQLLDYQLLSFHFRMCVLLCGTSPCPCFSTISDTSFTSLSHN